MALIFTDPNTSGPFATFQIKDINVKVFKLTFADFTTGGATRLVGRLPADASITNIAYWNKTKMAGGSVSASTLSVGTAASGTQYVNAYDVFTTVGTKADLSPITGIMQPYNIPYTADLDIWVTGTATTGNPTSGEIYLEVQYVR
jgi:hypothetical protein